MTDIHIPPAALEAGARADYEKWIELCISEDSSMTLSDFRPWHDLDEWERDEQRGRTRAAFEAMVGAWPLGMTVGPDSWVRCRRDGSTIILPLTETPDAEA